MPILKSLGLVFTFIICFGLIINAHAERSGKETRTLNVIVQSIYQSIGKSLCETKKRISVGLWKISDDRSPVGTTATKRIYDELISSLIQKRPECLDIIDSEGIGVIMNHLHKSGALDEAGGNELVALSQAHQKVDVIIYPEITSQYGDILLTLRAVERASAKTLALTSPSVIPKFLTEEKEVDTAISLEAAIRQATKEILQSASDVKEIQANGIFFENTFAQPPAARYIQEKILENLVQKETNSLTQKSIKVRGISIEPSNPETTQAQELDSQSIARNENIHELSGHYWIRNNALDLKLALSKPDGTTTGWMGRVRLDDLKGLELRPTNEATKIEPLPKAKYTFQVTTKKGQAPVHKPGEELQLMVRAGRDVWVYCFYVDSKSQISPIYPRSSQSGPANNAVTAKKLLLIPDPKKDSFRFVFNNKTSGEELVSCFAADRDVSSDLPSSLFPGNSQHVQFLTLEKLRDTFRQVKNAQVAESTVTITIIQ